MLLDFLFQSLIIDTVFLCPFLSDSIYFLVLSWGGFQKIWNMFSTKKKMSKHNWSHFFKGEGKKQRFTIAFWSILGWFKEFFTWNGAAAEILYIPTLHWFIAPPGNLHFLVKKRRDTTRGKFCTFLKKICGCGNTILWRVN